jgi:hypothetical protein
MSNETNPDVTLSNGRVFTHEPVMIGKANVIAADGGEMSDAEWHEFCDIIRHRAAERYKRRIEERTRRNREAFEIAKHQHLVGQYARSIESGWLGKVTAIEFHGGDLLCKMAGVDMLHNDVTGGTLDESLANNDTQWFVPEDLKFLKRADRLIKVEV